MIWKKRLSWPVFADATWLPRPIDIEESRMVNQKPAAGGQMIRFMHKYYNTLILLFLLR